MAARESEDADIMTTISVPNTNDISDDEEMSDATEKKGVGHNRRGVSPIHVPAEWGKAEPTGDDDPVCQQLNKSKIQFWTVLSGPFIPPLSHPCSVQIVQTTYVHLREVQCADQGSTHYFITVPLS